MQKTIGAKVEHHQSGNCSIRNGLLDFQNARDKSRDDVPFKRGGDDVPIRSGGNDVAIKGGGDDVAIKGGEDDVPIKGGGYDVPMKKWRI